MTPCLSPKSLFSLTLNHFLSTLHRHGHVICESPFQAKELQYKTVKSISLQTKSVSDHIGYVNITSIYLINLI